MAAEASQDMALMTVLGMMSGTSMDGVVAAILTTDGQSIGDFGPHEFRAYSEPQRTILRAALVEAKGLSDRTARPGPLGEAEEIVTAAHAEVAERLLRENPGI